MRFVGEITHKGSELQALTGFFVAQYEFNQHGATIDSDGIKSAVIHAGRMFRDLLTEKGYKVHVWPPQYQVAGNPDGTLAMITLAADLRTLQAEGQSNVHRQSAKSP